MLRKLHQKINYFFPILLLVITGITYFPLTAYDWPALDMAPFFLRIQDASFALNDFFTNSSMDPNPRFVFGYMIVFLQKLFNQDWYNMLYYVKTIFLLLLPILFYGLIVRVVHMHYQKDLNKIELLGFGFCVFALFPKITNFFSIAWWPSLVIQASAQTASLVFALTGALLLSMQKRSINFLAIAFFFTATVLHPAVGIFTFLLFVIATYPFVNNRLLQITLFLGVVLPSILIKILFGLSYLSSFDFVKYYVIEAHSSHYYLPDFGSLTILPWYFSFLLVVLLLGIPCGYFLYFYLLKRVKKYKFLFILSVLFVGAYIFSVIIQVLFTIIMPNKLVASLGPVRFTMFSYWMIAVLWMLFFLNCFQNLIYKFFQTKFILAIPKLKFKLFLASAFIFIFVFFIHVDHPVQTLNNRESLMYEFIKSTPKGSVFAVFFGNFTVDIPVVTHRSVFCGNGFPFSEKNIEEYIKRRALLYGDRISRDKSQGKWEGEKMANYYRNLKPSDFLMISKKFRLDYFMIENQFSSEFKKLRPVFKNSKISIYKV